MKTFIIQVNDMKKFDRKVDVTYLSKDLAWGWYDGTGEIMATSKSDVDTFIEECKAQDFTDFRVIHWNKSKGAWVEYPTKKESRKDTVWITNIEGEIEVFDELRNAINHVIKNPVYDDLPWKTLQVFDSVDSGYRALNLQAANFSEWESFYNLVERQGKCNISAPISKNTLKVATIQKKKINK